MSKSALELVVQLRTLAQDPNNRPHLIPAGDYVPPGLVMWLDHPSSDVVFNGKVLVFEFCASARRFACVRAPNNGCAKRGRCAVSRKAGLTRADPFFPLWPSGDRWAVWASIEL